MKRERVSVEEKYPLSEHEENLLVNELLGSGAMFIILGIVFSIVFTGLRTGDWFWSVLEFGWAYEFGQAMTLGRMPVVAAAAAVGLPAFFILMNEIIADKILWKRSQKYRDDVREMRSGINGELPRMSLASRAVTASVAGFAEEFSFRYALISFLALTLGWVTEPTFGMVASVLITSFVFASAHGQYERSWERIVVFSYAFAFGAVFLVTGSLLSVVIAHALYDFCVEALERRRMLRDPEYFGEAGAPDHVVEEQLKELRDYFDKFMNRRD